MRAFRTPRATAMAGIVVGALVLTANAGSIGSEPIVMAAGSNSFPSENPSDWVTYATHIVVAQVIQETEIAPSPVVAESQDGYIGRTVTLEVMQLLWRDGRTGPVERITLDAPGWSLSEGTRTPIAIWNSPRFEVGEVVLVPLSMRSGEWTILAPDAVMPVVDGKVAPLRVPEEEDGTVHSRFRGMTADGVADLLRGTDIDPAAAPYMDLEPYARARAVVEDRAARAEN